MQGLGHHIKALRKARHMTLVEMAGKTGIDEATLSRIENAKMTGTLDSHQRIAQALEIRLPDLYQQVLAQEEARSEGQAKEKFETFFHKNGVVAELLTSGFLRKKMMPVLLRLEPHRSADSEAYTIGSERFLYVLEGQLRLTIGKDNHPLKAGESIYFQASIPHQLHNTFDNPAAVLSVLTPPAP